MNGTMPPSTPPLDPDRFKKILEQWSGLIGSIAAIVVAALTSILKFAGLLPKDTEWIQVAAYTIAVLIAGVVVLIWWRRPRQVTARESPALDRLSRKAAFRGPEGFYVTDEDDLPGPVRRREA